MAVIDPERSLTKLGDQVRAVRYENNRHPAGLKLAHLGEAFFLEEGVADGKDFVDEEEVRVLWTATAKPRRPYMPDE
ncbi:MAG: hypothetical protein ACREWE_03480 [Gammaproteobacteria bacterium]